ncbi:DUF1146 family protein [Fructilactobacillus vespulae]|uniref:DUF1146 family protein n=1 Tax=Fructilactobacillus vespulae TaxID=1249630 RepID=UPI0039B4CC4F
MALIGIQILLELVCQIFFIILAFWAIQGIHFERFLPIKEMQGKVLIVLVSISIGYLTSSFFLSFVSNLKNLSGLF